MELLLQGHEEGIVLEPILLALDELVKGPVGHPQEAFVSFVQNRPPVFIQNAIIHPVLLSAPGDRLHLLPAEKALIHQELQVNEVVISSKSGKGLIGGIPIACGAEGQDLPVLLPGLLQKIHKAVGRLSHSSNPIGAGQ